MIQFPKILMLESLNKMLKNNGGDRLNHSHFSLERSQADTDLSLNLLLFTSKPTPNTYS